MNYREYLMDIIIKNTTTMATLDRFIDSGCLSASVLLDNERISMWFGLADITTMEEWLDEHGVDYEQWELYYNDVDAIAETIEEQAWDPDLLDAWNEYAERMGGDTVYDMEDLDWQLRGKLPTEILELAAENDFDYSEDYFTYDGTDLVSGSLRDFADIYDLAEYILSNDDSLGLPELMVDDFR